MPSVISQHIDSVPGKCGGKPCVAGTRIRVWDIYLLHGRQGKTVDEVVAAYPELSLADVHAAMAYYYDHKPEIDAQMSADDELDKRLLASEGPGPLTEKLAKQLGGSLKNDEASN